MSIELRDEVCNDGDTFASSTDISYYISSDAVIDPSDLFLGTRWLPPLGPGQCDSSSVFVTPFAPDGAYFLGSIIDIGNFVGEANEANNSFNAGDFGLGFGPDLKITELSGPTGAAPGASITVRATVCNRGTSPAAAEVNIYLSADQDITGIFESASTDDGFLGALFSPGPLFPRQCRELAGEFFAWPPSPFTDGPYYLGAIADEQQWTPELIETNNETVGTRIGVGNGPDLVVTSLTGPSGVFPGGMMNVEATVCNYGTASAWFADVQVHFDPSTPLGYVSIFEPIGPGRCRVGSGDVPALLAPPGGEGAYQLHAWVDPWNNFFELNEENNELAGAVVGVGFQPDLSISGLEAPHSGFSGNSIEVSATVCNGGTISIGPSEVAIEISGVFAGLLTGNVSLSAGQCRVISGLVPVTAPSPFQGVLELTAIADPFNNLLELNETNNESAPRELGVGFDPDLVVTAISAPPSAAPGASIEVSATVCNYGTTLASGPDVNIYVSADAQIDGIFAQPWPSDDTFVGTLFADGLLPPGRCREATGSVSTFIPFPFTNGEYRIGAIVDESEAYNELNEENNRYAGPSIGLGFEPDLVITAILAPPSVEPWQQFPVEATICNRGQAPTGSAELTFYLSADETIEGIFSPAPSGDGFLGIISFSNLLLPGRCTTVSGELSATLPPNGMQDRSYYLAGIVDELDNIGELLESNNIFVGKKIGIGFLPDLIVDAIDAPASVIAGGWMNVGVRLCNRGTSAAFNAEVNIYFSADQALEGVFQTTWPSEEAWLGTAFLPNSLSPGHCGVASAQVNAMAPPFTIEGPYYLGAIADETNLVLELNEENNERVEKLVGFGSGPDLEITALHGPHSAVPGALVEVSATVCNRGTVLAEPADIQIYLSADRTIEPYLNAPWPIDDAHLGAVTLIDVLQAGQCGTARGPVNVFPPAPYFDGAYYLGAYADEAQQMVELIESNNIFVGEKIGVGFGPDLMVTELSGGSSAQPGQQIQVSGTICNYGTELVGSAAISIYLTEDEDLESIFAGGPSEDSFLGMLQTSNGIVAGGCRSFSEQMVVSTNFNRPHFLAAWTDEQNDHQELNEENNTFVGEKMGIGFGPDLLVTSIRGPNSVFLGAFADLEVTVCNRGTDFVSSADVSLYVSLDEQIEGLLLGPPSEDFFLTQAPVGSLFPGQCRTVEVAANIHAPWPSTPGSYYLGAIVDEFQAQLELIEENNVFTGERIGIGSLPDLSISALTAPRSATHGGLIDVAVTLCNEGATPAGFTDVAISLSAAPDSPGTHLGSLFFPFSLDPGACRIASSMMPAATPPPFTDGTYYLSAVVDPWNSVSELDEENNIFSGREIGLGFSVDFVVTDVRAAESAQPGLPLEVDATICNYGTQAAGPGEINIYLSFDEQIDGMMPMSEDSYLGTLWTNVPLGSGECAVASGQVTVFVPPPFVDGGYYLAAIADEWNGYAELNEENNTFVGPRIGVGNGPDLVASAVVGPASATPGQTIEVAVSVCNYGTDPVGNAEYSLYLSEDAMISGILQAPWPSDDSFLGIFSTNAPLSAGECLLVENTVNAWPPTPGLDGAYYLGAIVDETNGFEELREDNNRTTGTLMGIGSGPDLMVSELSAPPFVLPGAGFLVSSTICNQGTAQSAPVAASFELGGEVLGIRGVPPLLPGECSVELGTFLGAGSVPLGQYSFLARADSLGWVDELVETNNHLGVPLAVAYVFCGNFSVDHPGEQCDDGNFQSGDGCTAGCIDEYCGDALINDGALENCDDGNSSSGDGCSNICRLEYCGDGAVNNGGAEQCDDGNSSSGDGCSATCNEEYCGDGAVNNGGVEECDDGNQANWDGCSSKCERESPRLGEVGTVSMNQPNRATWHTVNLQRTYRTPVVIMEALSSGDSAYAHIRVRNVSSNSFQWQIEEWQYQDGVHGTETANYLVVEAGRRILEDGTVIEAGRTTANNAWKSVSFSTPFGAVPSVLTSLNSRVDAVPVVTRTRNLRLSSFQVMVQEEEAQPQAHGTETISWIAFETGNGMNNGKAFIAGRTPDAVTHAQYTLNFLPAFTSAPIFIGHADRFDQVDTVALRWSQLTASSVRVRMEEEDSLDPESTHTTEVANWVAWASAGFITFEASSQEAPSCNDLLDNDGDGLVDCSDPECAGISPCP